MSLPILACIYCRIVIKDFKVACDCPDYEVPCKHIAGVCYRLAGQLDQDPFLLFEMRGLAPEKLLQELANSPLGKVLSDAKSSATVELAPVASFYTRPVLAELPQETSLKGFWHGQQPLPKEHRTQPGGDYSRHVN